MKKDKLDNSDCEQCLMSESCTVLDSKKCGQFALAIDSNFKYMLDAELLYYEKKYFALYLS